MEMGELSELLAKKTAKVSNATVRIAQIKRFAGKNSKFNELADNAELSITKTPTKVHTVQRTNRQ